MSNPPPRTIPPSMSLLGGGPPPAPPAPAAPAPAAPDPPQPQPEKQHDQVPSLLPGWGAHPVQQHHPPVPAAPAGSEPPAPEAAAPAPAAPTAEGEAAAAAAASDVKPDGDAAAALAAAPAAAAAASPAMPPQAAQNGGFTGWEGVVQAQPPMMPASAMSMSPMVPKPPDGGYKDGPQVHSEHIKLACECKKREQMWGSEMRGRWFNEEVKYFEWFNEEVKYFEYVFELFKDGLLQHVETNVTFRELMAAVLQCEVMRISKKFTGDARIGHLRFPKAPQRLLSPAEIEEKTHELNELEASYLAQRAVIRPRKRQRNSRAAELYNASQRRPIVHVCVLTRGFPVPHAPHAALASPPAPSPLAARCRLLRTPCGPRRRQRLRRLQLPLPPVRWPSAMLVSMQLSERADASAKHPAMLGLTRAALAALSPTSPMEGGAPEDSNERAELIRQAALKAMRSQQVAAAARGGEGVAQVAMELHSQFIADPGAAYQHKLNEVAAEVVTQARTATEALAYLRAAFEAPRHAAPAPLAPSPSQEAAHKAAEEAAAAAQAAATEAAAHAAAAAQAAAEAEDAEGTASE
ncbi:hypothetical protein JKP88DRAFT_267420 [Tribonema minus]|uniref:Uncharacterized protein n=1 Tax=Tribonema minus TaxID=303371 RepID=A0A835ZAU3_9STRA|nr:hypothetical protein JKP88DRAFT_267420 [Tribonema minus]